MSKCLHVKETDTAQNLSNINCKDFKFKDLQFFFYSKNYDDLIFQDVHFSIN